VTDRNRRLLATAAGVGILVGLVWFDGYLEQALLAARVVNFNLMSMFLPLGFAAIAVTAGVLALILIAWWSRSFAVAVLYVLVGTFFVFGPALLVTRGFPVPQFTTDLFGVSGPFKSGMIGGAGMLIAGFVAAARAWAWHSAKPSQPSMSEAPPAAVPGLGEPGPS
jgi:hypothetical protein